MDNLDKWINDPFIRKLLILAGGSLVLWTIILFTRRRVVAGVQNSATRYHSRKTITYVGYFLTIIFAALLFSSNMSNLGVALGVMGAGIAFALQEVIASIAGWLANSFGGFFRVGDRVQLGGIRGDVIDIGVLRTTLMELGQWVDGDLYNGRIVRVANSFIFKEPVFNYSADFAFVWDEIKVPVQYGSDYELAHTLLLHVAEEVVGDHGRKAKEEWKLVVRKYLIEDATTQPMISMKANDNWVEFTLRYVVDYKLRRTTKTRLFQKILKELDATNGAVKIASATFQLVDPPELKIRVREEGGGGPS